MIIHNRDIYNSEELKGSGLIDTVLSIVNGVIQHKDAIKDVVTVAKDVVNIGKDVKSLVKKDPPPTLSIVQPQNNEVPEDVKDIIKKIKSLSDGRGVPGEFRYV